MINILSNLHWIWRRIFELDHPGIKCVQSHNICIDCSKEFVNLVISEPTLYLPLKCPECKIELNPSNVFRTCTTEQEAKLHALKSKW